MDIKTINDYLNKHQYKELFNKANATFEEAEGNDNSLKMKEASEYIEELVSKFENVISCKANLKTHPIFIDFITNNLVEDAKSIYSLASRIWTSLNIEKSRCYLKEYQRYFSQFKTDFQGNEEKGVVVYSFRVCNNYTYADLANDTITLVRPKCMNDPFDSLVMMWFNENNIRNINKDYKKKNSSLHFASLAKSYQYYRIRSFCANTDTMKSDKTIPQNILMWSHYANGHKGICVKYRLKNDFVGSERSTELDKPYVCLKKISYGEDPNEIVNLNVQEMTIANGFLRKDRNWSYENEVRLISYNADCEEDFIALPMKRNAKIEAIYFGYKCTETEKEIVKKLTQNSNIKYYNIEPNFNDIFKLKIKPHSSKND